MSTRYISINQEILPEAEAKISVSDLALQRGYGIFDFLKIVNHKPVFLERYFDRFFNSAKEMYLNPGLTRDELRQAVFNLMDKNQMPNAGIKFILTGGFSPDGYQIARPNLVIVQSPFEIQDSTFEKGITLMTHNYQRQLAHVKTIDYLQAIRMQGQLQEQGIDDLLYHNDGHVRECPRANFFIVTDKEIITPANKILKGITRSKVLEMELEGYKISTRDFDLSDLTHIKEAFITSSTKNVLPVLAIDKKPVGNGQVGPVARALQAQMQEFILND